eukprot:6204493-Pleurochrysis_carterae.AAC.2
MALNSWFLLCQAGTEQPCAIKESLPFKLSEACPRTEAARNASEGARLVAVRPLESGGVKKGR